MDPGLDVAVAPPDPQRCVETAIRRGAPPDAEQLAHFEAQCARGDAAACSILGVMHERGETSPWNATRAWLLYDGACKQGNARACANLAGMLGSSARAAELYDYACRHDVPEACTKLGRLRSDRAAELYEIACSLGDAAGCIELGRLHEGARDVRRAAELYQRACVRGELSGCTQLDRLHARRAY